MAPSKLTIKPDNGDLIEVMFNPNSYTITKNVVWTPSTVATADVKMNAPVISFGGGDSRNLKLDLFFDTTEAEPSARDVRLETDKLVRLTRIDRKLGRPPVCVVDWGKATRKDFPFKGMVSSLNQRFVLFDHAGQPLRAHLDLTFVEFLNRDDDARQTDPETTTHVVRRGDSLASIAADVYRDPGEWRRIAVANGIEDPLVIPAGSKLTLPQA